ncbi:MAG TPA: fimbrillin family protein [Chitinophagales bacterium]|nr:fimbrillin family protein [Chitinophagales bacterium]HRX24725.1 fimbrillin family protein [Chitinophagales bacterium]
MKKIILPAVALAAVFSALTSCTKDEEPTPTPEAYSVTINIIEPSEGETITSGSTVHLEATFENDNTIHNIGVWMVGEMMNDTLYSYENHVHADQYYEFHEHTMPMVMEAQEYKVIFASWDEDPAERIEKHVHVNIEP